MKNRGRSKAKYIGYFRIVKQLNNNIFSHIGFRAYLNMFCGNWRYTTAKIWFGNYYSVSLFPNMVGHCISNAAMFPEYSD